MSAIPPKKPTGSDSNTIITDPQVSSLTSRSSS
jgi:hypothetical protein